MGEQGKCDDCGQPTTKRKDGTYWRKCFDCNSKAKAANDTKQETLPARSAQEMMSDIGATFKMAMDFMSAHYPGMPAELAVNCAMHLNNQYWKNDRTPR